MAASINNSSHARSRSLRSNTLGSLKPSSTAPPQTTAGPSNISLFLTNLRLLDLDLRDDWPGITALSLSTKDAKKRTQCVEWALYQLFAIWDPDDTRYKLQPFFPPLEPLQSINLRAALLRSLEQAKKGGALGRDTILRKTMLDECKGERMEEVLTVFSNAVLKNVLQESESEGHKAIAQVLALENFSYTGERTVLSALIMAHKASLSKNLREKEGLRVQYSDFADLLDLNERRIARRHEQLKQVIDERDDHDTMSARDVRAFQERVQNNWSGADDWLEAILYGDSTVNTDGVLGTSFNKVWNHVEGAKIGDLEGKKHVGLLEQLEARVQDQEAQLARWKDFGKRLCKNGPASPSKPKLPAPTKQKNVDLGFGRHQSLQIGRNDAEKGVSTPSSLSLEEYTRLIENMQVELADVGKLRSQLRSARHSITSLPKDSPVESLQKDSPIVSPHPRQESPISDEEWSSESDSDEALPVAENLFTSHAPLSQVLLDSPRQPTQDLPIRRQRPNVFVSTETGTKSRINTTPLVESSESPPKPHARPRTPPPIEPAREVPQPDSESELADRILNSVSAASPSPKKPRHRLSLAERTRLTMSRVSHSKFEDLHEDPDNIPDLLHPPTTRANGPQPGQEPIKGAEMEKHADLIERTRKSMAGFEVAQQKAQIARRRSMKDAKKKQRESSYFPKVEEEPLTASVDAAGLIEGDPDYEDVFKSRPKIKTSPAVSPNRLRMWEEGEGEE